MAKIYLASSWRCAEQPAFVKALREAGHEVYDFRNPGPGDHGFAWSQIDEDWLEWTPERYRAHVETSPVAAAGFKNDAEALDWCDTCVLLLPCGRSAHLELGWAIGRGKRSAIVLRQERFEPELMYLLADLRTESLDELLSWLAA